MAKSERAKALEAQQKAEVKALKQRRRTSSDPADWGRWRQLVESYKLAKHHDPALPWMMVGAGLTAFIAMLGLGFALRSPLLWGVFGLSLGLLCAMLVFAWRARKAVYKRFEGQAGSGEVALQMLPKQWHSTPVITATKQMDAVHRTVGPGGLVLIGEGNHNRLRPLLTSELKKHEQVAYGVEVRIIQMGDGEGQVPLDKLTDHLKKLPKSLTPAKVTEVRQRLKALDALRPKAPVPKGPINMKGARAAIRGR